MAKKEITEIIVSDLRALLFWATIGISKTKGGAYQDTIEDIIESYAKHFEYQLPRPPKFKD